MSKEKIVMALVVALVMVVLIIGGINLAASKCKKNRVSREADGVQYIQHTNVRVQKITIDGQSYILATDANGSTIAICPAKEKRE